MNTLTVLPAQKNGNSKAEVVNGKAATTTPAAAKNQTPEIQVKDEIKNELPPLEDRILKVQMLGDLIAKREKLQESLTKANKYRFTTENRDDKLTIEDAAGNEFWTTNTDVLRDVMETIKGTILAKIKEIDAKIIF